MKVLFVCTGNTCRSPMAAALFNAMASKAGLDAEADSRGVAVYGGGPASAYGIEVMAEAGIDMEAHRSQPLTMEDIENADLVLTMTAGHKAGILAMTAGRDGGKVHTLCEYVLGQQKDVGDPFGGGREIYAECRDELKNLVDMLVKMLG